MTGVQITQLSTVITITDLSDEMICQVARSIDLKLRSVRILLPVQKLNPDHLTSTYGYSLLQLRKRLHMMVTWHLQPQLPSLKRLLKASLPAVL